LIVKHLRKLTPEEFARVESWLRNPPPGSRAEAAKQYGVDLTLLIEQLRLSPAERVERMLEACKAAAQLRGLARREKP
jgi:hypothetical protein